MRLRDLDARFVTNVTATTMLRLEQHGLNAVQGVLFRCPSCGAGLTPVDDHEHSRRFLVGVHSILVLFSNPRGIEPAPADAGPGLEGGRHPRWTIEAGSTIDDLTLSPSINCDIPWKDAEGVQHESSCKFHGYVKNGEAA